MLAKLKKYTYFRTLDFVQIVGVDLNIKFKLQPNYFIMNRFIFGGVTTMFILFGCKKDLQDVQPAKTGTFLSDLIEYRSETAFDEDDINISIIANGVAWSDSVATVDIMGWCKDTTGEPLYVDSLFVNAELILADTNAEGLHRNVYGFNRSISNGVNLFGDDVLVRIPEHGTYKESSAEFYLPEIVNFIIYDHGGEIDTDENLTVTWYADNSNENGITIGVIGFDYNSSTQEYSNWIADYISTDDDGSHTIRSDWLSQFENSDNVQVAIARGSSVKTKILESLGYDLAIHAYTYSISPDIPIVN